MAHLEMVHMRKCLLFNLKNYSFVFSMILFVCIFIEFINAFGADSMAEFSLGLTLEICVYLDPASVVILDAFAGGAEGMNAPHLPHL